MTREEILSTEAGREMDALIAEKVMGEKQPIYVHEFHIDPIYSEGHNWFCYPSFYEGDICKWEPRNFSTDISAAWEVADWLRNYWGTFELIAGLSWHCWSELKDAKIWGTGNTAPLAICRAALLAVMEEG